MVGEGHHEDLRYAPSEKRQSDGPDRFLAHRMKNDVEQRWQIFREDFALFSELPKAASGHVFTMIKWHYYLTPRNVPERARANNGVTLFH